MMSCICLHLSSLDDCKSCKKLISKPVINVVEIRLPGDTSFLTELEQFVYDELISSTVCTD